MPLTPKQERFVDEYLIDLNATQAAIRAGYSKKTANKTASEYLVKPGVESAIATRQAERKAKTQITPEFILEKIANIVNVNVSDLATWDEDSIRVKRSELLTEAEASVVTEIVQTCGPYGKSVKVKTLDKLKALDLLGKHLGLFQDKGTDLNNVTIKIELPENR